MEKCAHTFFYPVAQLFKRAPMLRVAIAIAAGILLYDNVGHIPTSFLFFVAAASTVLMVMTTFVRSIRNKWFFYASLWILFISIGCIIASMSQRNFYHQIESVPWDCHQEATETLLLHVDDNPRTTRWGYRVPARAISVLSDGQWHSISSKMMLYLPNDSSAAALSYADCIVAMCRISVAKTDSDGRHFNYGLYLRRNGVGWLCKVRTGQWHKLPTPSPTHYGLLGWSKKVQRHLVDRLGHTNMTPSQLGVAQALLLGWRNNLDSDTVGQYRDAGIMHLLCVSGLHVGILAAIVSYLLFFLGRRRWQRVLRSVISIIIIWIYALITGMAPATTRAALMFSLLMIGHHWSNRPNAPNNLATSAVILLLFRPMLIYDVGFQLSYSALAGILSITSSLTSLLPIKGNTYVQRILKSVWVYVCLSTSAQLGSLPFVLYHFHQFPTYFLIANLTVIPFAGLILVTSLLVLATGGWPSAILQFMLRCVDGITAWVSDLPHATVTAINIDVFRASILALLIALLSLLLRMIVHTSTTSNRAV